MRSLVIGLALGLAACTAVPDREPERPVAETHVCTQSPDGLAECREIEPQP
ncbi:MAG: hypothetical protein Q8S27_07155 [Hoeflea sp.]|uniref:hypothetical protein n=1 Tax=Hoeflea sp. TaxID=1940281 RepID=UPI00273032C2|nr:hypothetical protein [Hoeflea sp.]MDP2121388.1 hypothetical protein [Hoeflea sp.]MDP3524339.1 hypothetical protein [Hoeflea sp.]